MFGKESELLNKLSELKNEYGLIGVKAEFEAEGSSFNDIVRLRRLTAMLGIELHVKIGGVEALRDLRDCIELGVDGVIAPMVESEFALVKFLEALDKSWGTEKVHTAINIETRSGFDQLDSILTRAQTRIDSVTFGRTDMSASFLDKAVTPDSDTIQKMVIEAEKKAKAHGLTFTVGGSIKRSSLERLNAIDADEMLLTAFETRKIIFSASILKGDKADDALISALDFEEMNIRSKRQICDIMLHDELNRLSMLEARK